MKSRIHIPANIRYTLTVVLLLLVMNFVLRMAFLLYNTAQASAMDFSEILMGFLVGIRFDLATIFIFNGLILFFLALPIRLNHRRRTYKVCNILLILANIPVLLANSIDVVYFGFSEKRLTHELFTTKSDYQSFKPDLLLEWWYLFVLFFVLIYLFYRVLNHFSTRHLARLATASFKSSTKHWVVALAFGILMYTGIRGGLQKKPLSMGQAFVGNNHFAGSLGLNSGFTVFSSVDWEEQPVALIDNTVAVQTTRQMIRNSFDGPFVSDEYPLLRHTQFKEKEKRYNVVYLIIESLNAKDVGCLNGLSPEQSLTPNIDTLVRHGRMYTHHYANGVRSVESIPALVNSMPDIFRRPTIGSHYAKNNHQGLGKILGRKGYHNAFFCGAHNGTMGFDGYAKTSGIPHYYGMDEYPHSDRDFDGYWGCYDGPFLKWMADQQSSFHEPFFSVFFSISNHHPFQLPPEGFEDLRKLPVSDMEKTVAYTDRMIGEYFQKVSREPWFDRTIFVLTGDHCFHEQSEPDRAVMDNFHVPLLVVAPCLEAGFDDRLSNHLNVMPTVMDVMRLDTWHNSMGISLLEDRHPYVINNLMGVATLAMDDVAYSTSFERDQPFYRLVNGNWIKEEDPKKLDSEVRADMDRRLRSLYQVMLNTRIENRMHHAPLDPISQAN